MDALDEKALRDEAAGLRARIVEQQSLIRELGIDRGVYQRRAFAAEEHEREMWDHIHRHGYEICSDLSKLWGHWEKTQLSHTNLEGK